MIAAYIPKPDCFDLKPSIFHLGAHLYPEQIIVDWCERHIEERDGEEDSLSLAKSCAVQVNNSQSVNMGRGAGYQSNGGQRENLATSLREVSHDQNAGKHIRNSLYPTRGAFHDLTRKLAASVSKDKPSRRRSSLKQSPPEDISAMSFQGLSSRDPQNQTQPDTTHDLYRQNRASTPDIARNARQVHSPVIKSPACHLTIERSRPRGPRAAPVQVKLALEKDCLEIRHNKQPRGALNLRQSVFEQPENRQAASYCGEAIQRNETDTSARCRSSYADRSSANLHSKKHSTTSNVMRTESETSSDSPHQEIQSEGLTRGSRDNDPGLNIAGDVSSDAAGNIGDVDAAAIQRPGRDRMLTRTLTQWLASIKTIFSGADEKLQRLAILSELGIWQRVIEMVVHVFTTLHHASPAFQVLRSTNARAGEYGKAMKDFSRAIVYLLVLLSLLQLVTQAVRIIVITVAALAWPFKMVWVVLRWVMVG